MEHLSTFRCHSHCQLDTQLQSTSKLAEISEKRQRRKRHTNYGGIQQKFRRVRQGCTMVEMMVGSCGQGCRGVAAGLSSSSITLPTTIER